jgi:hypothetical protein
MKLIELTRVKGGTICLSYDLIESITPNCDFQGNAKDKTCWVKHDGFSHQVKQSISEVCAMIKKAKGES